MTETENCFYHPEFQAVGECINCGHYFCKKLKIRGINTEVKVREEIEIDGQKKEVEKLKSVYCPVCIFGAIDSQTENMRGYYLKNIGSLTLFVIGIIISILSFSYDPFFSLLILIISAFMSVNIIYHLVYQHPKLIKEIEEKKKAFFQELDPDIQEQLLRQV